MNDLLRAFDRLLKPFGYRIRRAEKYVLQPLRDAADLPEPEALASAHRSFDGIGLAEAEVGLDALVICYRTCLRGDRRPAGQRPWGATDRQVVLGCLASLVAAVNHAAAGDLAGRLRIVVFDDHSDESEFAEANAILAAARCPVEVRTTRERGQGPSLHETFAFGATQNGLVYFCEDDYLHLETAISEMVAFYRCVHRQTGGHAVLHPQEQKSLYSPYYPSYLLRSDTRHWRTTSHMTHSFLTHGHVVRDHWRFFENTKYVGDKKKRRLGSERNTTNKLLAVLPGFCPIPAVGAHFHTEEELPPFTDWRALWTRHQGGGPG